MKEKPKRIIVILSLCLFIFIALLVTVILVVHNMNQKNNENENSTPTEKNETVNPDAPTEKKEIQIVDMNSNTRPYAVMINNHASARPQVGLDSAYLVYELMVEGGITRMMALYTTDVDVDKIGSVRSSRHYYLDYALENDAIYVHWGYSTYAEEDIKKLGIHNVNGLIYENKYFTTDYSLGRSLEHSRFTSSKLIKQAILDLGYRTTSNRNYLLNYTIDEVDLSKIEGSKVANSLSIKYSNYVTSSYQYHEEDQMYYRSINGEKQIDLITKEQYKVKNIIVYSVKYSTISSIGHQDLANIGTGTGYYITNGYAVPIQWSKKDRSSQTIYTYLDGSEIDVSDGNTFIQIYPTSGSFTINE